MHSSLRRPTPFVLVTVASIFPAAVAAPGAKLLAKNNLVLELQERICCQLEVLYGLLARLGDRCRFLVCVPGYLPGASLLDRCPFAAVLIGQGPRPRLVVMRFIVTMNGDPERSGPFTTPRPITLCLG